MKTLGMLKVLEVLCLALCTLLCLPDMWSLLLHSWRLQQAVQEWRDGGPHTTLVGRLRERLAAAGWLAPPRDPLLECGVPLGGGWTETLQRLYGADSYLFCLEREVEQAQQEHLAFRANLLLAAACAASVTVLAALMAVCGCLLLRLARRPQQQQQQQQAAEAAREVMPPGEAPRGEVQPRTDRPKGCPGKPARPSVVSVLSKRRYKRRVAGRPKAASSGPVPEANHVLPCPVAAGGQASHDTSSPVAAEVQVSHDVASLVGDMARECHNMASPVADMARECHNMDSPVATTARECHDMASPVADMARECHNMDSPVATTARECQPPPVSRTGDAACDPAAQATGRGQKEATPSPVVTKGPSQAAQAQEPPGLDTPPNEEGGASLPHEAGVFGPSSQDQGRETPASEEKPCTPPPVQEAPLEADEAASVVRCLHVNPRFRERLEGPNGSFLEHLGLQYGVLVFTIPAKRKMQIRGAKQRVLDCYEAVRALLAEWQAQDTA
ncbi:fibrous sheath CABYR-binding protein-like isoform X2 [Eriocheir sinensis]|uniref:fibrous sheath CABYR-binding protein-like isoform X2 n=1 Tax=Eriocheir sinensis TaxID=95602 RepID=UPI0021CA495A|nr:fibrous sheath CABYR-binding protein-like isoform X2 [Eriocheir sinensis]